MFPYCPVLDVVVRIAVNIDSNLQCQDLFIEHFDSSVSVVRVRGPHTGSSDLEYLEEIAVLVPPSHVARNGEIRHSSQVWTSSETRQSTVGMVDREDKDWEEEDQTHFCDWGAQWTGVGGGGYPFNLVILLKICFKLDWVLCCHVGLVTGKSDIFWILTLS